MVLYFDLVGLVYEVDHTMPRVPIKVCIGRPPHHQAIGLAVYPFPIEVDGEYAATRGSVHPGCSGGPSVAHHAQPVVCGQLIIEPSIREPNVVRVDCFQEKSPYSG